MLNEMPSKLRYDCRFLRVFSCCTYLLITKVIYVFGIFSLLMFTLLFSSFRNEVIVVSSYLRKPWRGRGSLPAAVQVRYVLRLGAG